MNKICSLVICLLSVWIISGCEKEYSVETGGGFLGGTQGSFRAKIDGVQWEANIIKSASRLNGNIELRGGNSDQKTIILQVKDSGVHNYQLYNTSTTNVGTYIDSSAAPVAAFATNQWFADSTYGNVNITRIDTVRKTMSGTFNLYVFRSLDGQFRRISEGAFTDIPYGVPVTPPPPAGADTFRVKVDGSDFTYSMLSGTSAFTMISISAMQGSGSSVLINLPESITPGTYDLAAMTTIIAMYMPSASEALVATSGSLTILEHNTTTKRIRGTFNFIGEAATPPPSPANLTEGYFSVSY